MTRLASRLVLLLVVSAGASTSRAGDFHAALEVGGAWQARNDFRIPGDAGTLVELPDAGPVPSFRATLTWDLTPRQSVRLLAAPLRIEQTFTPSEPVSFQGLEFPAGVPADSSYRFDSYRATWYWRFAPKGKWSFRLGATLKVRSAEIGLDGAPGSATRDDLGVVPLLYAYARYQASDRLAVELEADALAAPQGRAEDVSLKGVFRVSDRVEVDLGYRVLEGGADNDEVYTFALFHYAVAGVRLRF
jgi:hypothetical protein